MNQPLTFFDLEQPDPRSRHRSRLEADRTSRYIRHQGRKERAKRLMKLAQQQARLAAKMEPR